MLAIFAALAEYTNIHSGDHPARSAGLGSLGMKSGMHAVRRHTCPHHASQWKPFTRYYVKQGMDVVCRLTRPHRASQWIPFTGASMK